MASENYQLAAKSRQLPRARCIPDADWETHRERLTELYLESDTSRKDIVEMMAQHNFVITYWILCPTFVWILLTLDSETQLKRRFQFWGIKKYIPHQDMTAILSLKMRHDAAGEKVRIQYKDHEVDHDRIERALKRRKGPLSGPRCKTSNNRSRLN